MTEKKSGTPRAKARRIRRPAEEKNAEKVQLSDRLELLVTVVNRNKAEYFADLLTGFEVNMQLFVPARGTADAKTLSYLGLTDADKGGARRKGHCVHNSVYQRDRRADIRIFKQQQIDD